MLIIRLQRIGKKHDPAYRVVLTDSKRAASSGAFKEVLGFYEVKKSKSKFNGDKIKEWIAKGAKVSGTVHNLLVKEKIITGPKRNVLPSAKKKAGEASKEVKAEIKQEVKQVEELAKPEQSETPENK